MMKAHETLRLFPIADVEDPTAPLNVRVDGEIGRLRVVIKTGSFEIENVKILVGARHQVPSFTEASGPVYEPIILEFEKLGAGQTHDVVHEYTPQLLGRAVFQKHCLIACAGELTNGEGPFKSVVHDVRHSNAPFKGMWKDASSPRRSSSSFFRRIFQAPVKALIQQKLGLEITRKPSAATSIKWKFPQKNC